jgi:hypothetical protein
MRGLVASTFFSVLLLAAPLRPGLPSQLVGQASAGEPDQLPPVESTQSPSAAPSSGAASVAKICDALAAAAGENNLPVDFFARLIWQESRFDPTAVKAKQPFAIAMKDGSPFGIAGIWENWKEPASGEWIRTFAIITTDSNELVADTRTGRLHPLAL